MPGLIEPKPCAYVTLLTQDSYLQGVLALASSAIIVKLKYPLIVMYTDDIGQDALSTLRSTEECQLHHLKEPFLPSTVDHSQYVRSLYAQCWNKLRLWQWIQYQKIIYLDADMILSRNIDHLFDLPSCPLYAVGDCFGGRETEEERNACCHFTPHLQPSYFNAGFFMCEPSLDVFAQMNDALDKNTIPVGRFAEQDWLNGFFADRWCHLPYYYNAQKRIKIHHPELWDLNKIAIIHYVDDKPWSHRYSEENMMYQDIVEYWWKIYDSSGEKTEGEEELVE